jgi:hypothetical protein
VEKAAARFKCYSSRDRDVGVQEDWGPDAMLTDPEGRAISGPYRDSTLMKSYKAMRWVMSTSGIDYSAQENETSALTKERIRSLLCTSYVPLPHAALLVAAGLRFSYEQLLTAAEDGVKGLWVWVGACQKLGVPSGLPLHVQRRIGLQQEQQQDESPQVGQMRHAE